MTDNNFDRNAILEEIGNLVSDIAKAFIPGSYEWANETRPELVAEIRKTASLIDNNYVDMKSGAVRNAMIRCRKLHEAMFQQYERQLNLFGGAQQ